ncbi:ROK family transcriptional regulator [Sphaerotilus uruguayifluvii]|uniref:NBD/HSP70 family sugar kinase n=1 Tax=Sphaerotilus uruguayifluvii TaxID=2735897 RepID=A0ABX2G2B6_9BURK|nr:putative NBD/HSP70 family sugar kinase [Leptothrix sp. C29]
MNTDSASSDPTSRRPPRGSNQNGMRQFNERVVLQAIRLHGELPKAELARVTRLSTQTISMIVNALLDEGLLLKREPLRGRIGQPSVPIALDPDGAWSIGVKVGRQHADVLLVDFTGRVHHREGLPYAWPDPEHLPATLAAMIRRCREALTARLLPLGRPERLCGVGVAAPLSIGGWTGLFGMPEAQARAWETLDLPGQLAGATGLPVHFAKDTVAACLAEMIGGEGRQRRSFLYFFVDTFIGGGLVLDSHLHPGAHGNAGAVGSMPLAVPMNLAAGGSGGAGTQLLGAASLLNLQRLYETARLDPGAALDERALEPPWVAHTQAWLGNASRALAMAITGASCVLDLDDIVIDGVVDRRLLARLITQTGNALDLHCWEGVRRPRLHPGTIGSDARALGGALLPLHADFAPDPEVFLKMDPRGRGD